MLVSNDKKFFFFLKKIKACRANLMYHEKINVVFLRSQDNHGELDPLNTFTSYSHELCPVTPVVRPVSCKTSTSRYQPWTDVLAEAMVMVIIWEYQTVALCFLQYQGNFHNLDLILSAWSLCCSDKSNHSPEKSFHNASDELCKIYLLS